MVGQRGLEGCGRCPGRGWGTVTVAWPPWPLPHPSSLPSPRCVAPAHSCPQHPSLSPPRCGADEFSREGPEAQHVGWLHPRPGGPRPASEGPSPAFESAQGVRGPRPETCWGPRFGHSSLLRAPPRTAEKAPRPGLGLPVRPEPSLALGVSLDLALPLSSGPLTPQGGSWYHDAGAEGVTDEGPRLGALGDSAQRLLGAVLSPVLASSSPRTWSRC